jgi:arginyl-tRNA synthetase
MKEIIADLLCSELKVDKNKIEDLIEVPPVLDMGDYAFPVFTLSKEIKKNPLEVAKEMTEKLRKKLPKEISGIENKGAYINFFVDKNLLAEIVLKDTTKKNWGKINIVKKKVGLEYPSPNTNKALHVGHLRNIAIGNSVLKILEATGSKVIHLNLYNDRGILISKSMMGYELFSKGKTPESEKAKSDKFVADLYVKFSKQSKEDPELEKQALQKLQLWEEGDNDTIELWKKMNGWAYQGIEETFKKFGLYEIDKNYYESEIYKKGKEIIEKGLKKGIFEKKEDGAVSINLEKENLGEKILLRSDGTSLYVTQDIYLADKKIRDFDLDSSYYVVGNDQDYHFRVLFSILEKFGIKKDWKHLSYGMVALPTGKMKSREGSAVSADDLIEETVDIAKKGLVERDAKLSKKEQEDRSLKIALAAIKYTLLKVDIKKKIIFDPNKDLEFEGNTGPYLLYSYARANSIIKKVKSKKPVKIIDLKDSEIKLIKKINEFPEIIKKAYEKLSPNLIANYSFELAQIFNEFYHNCPVMGSIEEGFRLRLVDSFKITMKKSLELLAIDVLEEM